MESVGLLITLVFLKQHLGDSSVTSYFSSVCELSAVKMEISIAIKTTISANKSICDTYVTQKWLYSVLIEQLKVAGVAFLL